MKRNKWTRVGSILCTVLMFTSVLAGCNGGTSAPAASTAPVGAAQAPVSTAQNQQAPKPDLKKLYDSIPNQKAYISLKDIGDVKAKGNYKVGLALYTVSTGFYKTLADSLATELKNSGATVLNSDCNGDVTTQVSQIENFITQKVDAIILTPADPPSAINIALNKAYDAGIPVIAVDMPPDAGAKYLTAYVTDAYQLGYIIGEEVAKKLLAENPKGDIEYGIIGGIEGGVIPTARYNGSQDGIKAVDKEGRIKLVSFLYAGDFSEEGGLKTAENMLVAKPNLKAIIGTCDAHVVGATAAAKRQGKDKNLIMAAVDGSKAALEIMKAGGPIKAIGLNSPKEVGQIAARATIAQLNGNFVPKSKVMYMDPILVTADNVDKYYDPDSAF